MTTKKRPNGGGTIYQRKDGRYEGAAYVLTTTGTRKRVRVYGKSWDEANRALTKALADSHAGIPVAAKSQTIAGYLEYWLDEVAKYKVRPTTYRTYRVFVQAHLVPGLGRKRLDRLTARDVRVFLNSRRKQGESSRGMSSRSVFHLHAILRNALEHAVREDLVPRNVARHVQVSVDRREDVQPYTVDEAKALLRAVRDDRLYAFYAVAVSLGLRRAEALGLKWSAIDWQSGAIHVRRSLQRVNGRLVLLNTKTRRSRRSIPLMAGMAAVLREHQVRQKAEAEAADWEWQDGVLVFTTEQGEPISPDRMSYRFRVVCAAAGLRRIRLHDLRHTCASLLLAQGVSPRVVMEILGHSSLDMTMNVYAHVRLDAQRDALRTTDELFQG